MMEGLGIPSGCGSDGRRVLSRAMGIDNQSVLPRTSVGETVSEIFYAFVNHGDDFSDG